MSIWLSCDIRIERDRASIWREHEIFIKLWERVCLCRAVHKSIQNSPHSMSHSHYCSARCTYCFFCCLFGHLKSADVFSTLGTCIHGHGTQSTHIRTQRTHSHSACAGYRPLYSILPMCAYMRHVRVCACELVYANRRLSSIYYYIIVWVYNRQHACDRILLSLYIFSCYFADRLLLL